VDAVDSPNPADLPARLRLALRTALKARDATAVSALRSALSAISNAEAIDPVPAASTGHPHIAGAAGGLGAGEAPRRHLTQTQIDRADRLRLEAGALQSVLQA
jgi:hypothetical protein